MPHSSSQKRNGGLLRSYTSRCRGTAEVQRVPFSSEFDTPPPPSRRLRSRSIQVEPMHMLSSPPFPMTADLASRPSQMRTSTDRQQSAAVSASSTRSTAIVAPHTSRLPSTSTARHRREPTWEGHPDSQSNDVTALLQPPGRVGAFRVTPTRPLAIVTEPPTALKSSLYLSSPNFRSAVANGMFHQVLRHQSEGYGDAVVQSPMPRPSSAALSDSMVTRKNLSAPEEAPSLIHQLSGVHNTPTNNTSGDSAAGTVAQMSTSSHPVSLSLLLRRATRDSASPAVAQPTQPLTQSRHATSSGPAGEGGTAEHSSVRHQGVFPTGPQSTPGTEASTWCLPASLMSTRVPSSPPEGNTPVNSIRSTSADIAAAISTEINTICSSSRCIEDCSACSPTGDSTSLCAVPGPPHSARFPLTDPAHPRETGEAQASEKLEKDQGMRAASGARRNSAPLISHCSLTSQLASTMTTALGHALPEAANTTHAPEQYRQRGALQSSVPAQKAATSAQRGASNFNAVGGAPPRPSLLRDNSVGGGGSRTASSGRGASKALSHSPLPTRSPRTNPGATPHRLGNSSDRHSSSMPITAAPAALSSGVAPGAKSPGSALSTELAKHALKDRRRRELYAWNEQLRLQNESGVQDAV